MAEAREIEARGEEDAASEGKHRGHREPRARKGARHAYRFRWKWSYWNVPETRVASFGAMH
jgi:hypothetical protein